MKHDGAVLRFRQACDELARAVNAQLFGGSRSPYWVGGVPGGACDFEDCDFLSADDMVRILEHGLSYPEYALWRDHNAESDHYINLHSWLMGLRHCMIKPRTDDEGNQD